MPLDTTNRLSAAGAPDGNQVLDSIALNNKAAVIIALTELENRPAPGVHAADGGPWSPLKRRPHQSITTLPELPLFIASKPEM